MSTDNKDVKTSKDKLMSIRRVLVEIAIFLLLAIALVSGLFLFGSPSSEVLDNNLGAIEEYQGKPGEGEVTPTTVAGTASTEASQSTETSPSTEASTTTQALSYTEEAAEEVTSTTEEPTDEATGFVKLFDDEITAPEMAIFALLILLIIDLIAIAVISLMLLDKKDSSAAGALPVTEKPDSKPDTTVSGVRSSKGGFDIQIATIHNIGARPYQEDSLGYLQLEDGVLAVVADGMGGLSAGDKVSQKIVQAMTEYGKKLTVGQMDGVLEKMVNGTNTQVNNMLGPAGIYKSGSTLLSVLVRNNRFNWLTVGDSRIYLFRNGQLKKLNWEHNLGNELLRRAERGEISIEEAKNNPKKSSVTSFIGMGKLKYIDKSAQSLPIEKGDCIMLMTDGVFNTMPESGMIKILSQIPDIKDAANQFELLIKQRALPKQDNFSAIFIKFC